MIQSMTGFGRSEGRYGDMAIVAELRSTNHKYCDIAIRLPKFLLALETPLKKLMQKYFTRGRLELAVTVNGAAAQTKRLNVDWELADEYFRMLKDLKTKLELPGLVDLSLLTGFRDMITISDGVEVTDEWVQWVQEVIKDAVNQLVMMRLKEGRALAKDLQKRTRAIEKALRHIESRVPGVVRGYQARLKERINQLTHGVKIDKNRLAQEVALYAERCDISEELTRLKSHLKQFTTLMRKNDSVGRSLDFLIQEMNREVNTIGSKANDAAIAMEVVYAKSEMERLREQVQNIE